MKGNVLMAYCRGELQDGCAIHNNARKNMQRKNAIVERTVAAPMFQRIVAEVLVFRNQLVQKEAEESEPKNGNGNFLKHGLMFI